MDAVPTTSKGVRFGDKKFEETLEKWCNGCDSDDSDTEGGDLEIESDHDTASEQEIDSSDEEVETQEVQVETDIDEETEVDENISATNKRRITGMVRIDSNGPKYHLLVKIRGH